MKPLVLLLGLWAGCAHVPRVAECTIDESQAIADPLADVIRVDVRMNRCTPSDVLWDQIQSFISRYGLRVVRCGLAALRAEWLRDDSRTLENQLAVQLVDNLLERTAKIP